MFKKKAKSTSVDTMIGKATVVTGDLVFSGGLLIEGRVSGKVSSAKEDEAAVLILNEGGVIEGDLSVPNAIINGTVNGDMRVSARTELAENAKINGNVYYSVLEMTPGAKINGSLVNQEVELFDDQEGMVDVDDKEMSST